MPLLLLRDRKIAGQASLSRFRIVKHFKTRLILCLSSNVEPSGSSRMIRSTDFILLATNFTYRVPPGLFLSSGLARATRAS